jgi:hypothetical protein
MYYDIFELIYNELINARDILNFRLLNKECNNIFIDYFQKIKTNFYPRTTYINIYSCNVCNDFNDSNDDTDNLNFFIYKYDRLPHKCVIHCMNKNCFISVIKKYLIDIKINNIYPFHVITDEFIQKNNLKNINKDSLLKYNNKYYIRYRDDYFNERYTQVRGISKLKNNNLFNWFLKRNY